MTLTNLFTNLDLCDIIGQLYMIMAKLIAIGVNDDGYREVIGADDIAAIFGERMVSVKQNDACSVFASHDILYIWQRLKQVFDVLERVKVVFFSCFYNRVDD